MNWIGFVKLDWIGFVWIGLVFKLDWYLDVGYIGLT